MTIIILFFSGSSTLDIHLSSKSAAGLKLWGREGGAAARGRAARRPWRGGGGGGGFGVRLQVSSDNRSPPDGHARLLLGSLLTRSPSSRIIPIIPVVYGHNNWMIEKITADCPVLRTPPTSERGGRGGIHRGSQKRLSVLLRVDRGYSHRYLRLALLARENAKLIRVGLNYQLKSPLSRIKERR